MKSFTPMKSLLIFTLALILLSQKSNDERILYKGTHPGVEGKVELILHGKRTINIAESNIIEIRGKLSGKNFFRLQASGMSLSKVKGKGMYDIRPGPGKNLSLKIVIANPTSEVRTVKTIKLDRFVKNKWPKKQ
jgi:hypothetical protein